jgi:Asp-tRNA(Asn)/Glu-tRNA(Gln) amidotransferase A subunit family amidase
MSANMSNPNSWTIAAARDALRKGEINAVDLTMACLTAMDAGDALNAFVHKTPEIALEQARAADARLAKGDAPSMCGIPLGIKDLFCTKGVPSQAASNILRGFKPEYESTVTAKLFDAGAVMLGKLNMDEFAMGSSNESSCYGPAVNPWKVKVGRGSRPLPCGHRHRHRRLDPPACGFHRHHRHQADLWPCQPLGHHRLCLLAGSGRSDDQIGARRRDLPTGHVGP